MILSSSQESKLYAFLDLHHISYEIFKHAPVFTTQESEDIKKHIPGAHSKNLFLKDKKRNFALLSILSHKEVDLTAFSKTYGKGRFTFGNQEELYTYLGVTPGSVTPFGLICDEQPHLHFYLDEGFLRHDYVNFHPLKNDKTLHIHQKDFLRFFSLLQCKVHIISVPEKIEKLKKPPIVNSINYQIVLD